MTALLLKAWGWLAGTRLGRWVGMIGAGVALLAGAVLFGWSKRGQAEATKALEGYKRTRKEMDDAPHIGDDPGAARRVLRERKRSRNL